MVQALQERQKTPTAADAYLTDARGLNLMGMRDAYSQEYFRDEGRASARPPSASRCRAEAGGNA
jgi:hypothetical protein